MHVYTALTCIGMPSGPSGAVTTGFWYLVRRREGEARGSKRSCRHGEIEAHPITAIDPVSHVLEQHRLRDGGPVVHAGAAVSMTTCADLKVEGAVHAILLGSEDGGQVLRHPACSGAIGPRWRIRGQSVTPPPHLACQSSPDCRGEQMYAPVIWNTVIWNTLEGMPLQPKSRGRVKHVWEGGLTLSQCCHCCVAALPVASAAPTLTTAPEGLIRRCCSCGSYCGAGAEDDTLTSTPSGPCSLWWRPMMDSGAAGRGEGGRVS